MSNPGTHGQAARLVVIIPEELAGSIDLAKKTYAMSNASRAGLVYIALLSHPENRWALERSLATLKAQASTEGMPAVTRIAPANAWNKALQETIQPGDTLACLAEHRVSRNLFRSEPIRAALEKSVNARVLVLSGLYHPAAMRAKRLLVRLILWAGLAAILAGFTLLEVQLNQVFGGAARMLLFLILVTLEIGAVYTWNNIFER